MTTHPPFTGKVFVGTSVDGFIARTDGTIEWLTSRGNALDDYGFDAFIADIDTVVLGRATYEELLGFGPDMWPYGDRRIAVLSTRLETDDSRVTVYRDLDQLIAGLADSGASNVYVDGGQTIQTFLRAGLIHEITITTVPVLIGTGLALFGPLDSDVPLNHRSTKDLGAGIVQSTYTVAA
ncbi:dihydrofolate reductase [Lipingzhangella halophila]|uniref:Dihydrofolate reductase n=1 Tax=Lipingzhangella halophila TaxID=1783352 RepID=A0A7W7W5C9_9ACTN|nr:dihydrofolate reductase family protein [Lipingzhangella halophila]MBB4935127.1 dihydrofolate reductase [Lipingzhangella halophila]